MGKWKSGYDSDRKFKKEWMKEFLWVTEAPDGSQSAYCKLCKCNIIAKKCSLVAHENTSKHKERAPSKSLAPPLGFQRVEPETDVKRAELEMAVALCCHCSISSIDHLGELMKRHGQGSTLGKMKLHRTKCSKLLTEVVSPAMKAELKKAAAGKKFSIIVDESTDVACGKHMAVMVRFYHELQKKLATEFLELVPVHECDSQALFTAIKGAVEDIGLTLSDCVGYGSDGASAMVGNHNSVWTRVKEESPNCIQMRCICHSLALCVQSAFEVLPSSIGFMLSEIPKWFKKSNLRRGDFESLFNVMNPDGERMGTSSPFQQASATRWLARGKVLGSILSNWEELKAYFMCAEAKSGMAAKYKCRMLRDMLTDPTMYWYFQCITPIIQEFERVNACFQATDADPGELEEILDQHYRSLKLRVFSADGEPRQPGTADLGAKFAQDVTNHLHRQPVDAGKVQVRCKRLWLQSCL